MAAADHAYPFPTAFDFTFQGCDVAAAEARLASLPDVTSVHDLHIWTVTDGIESASAHVVVAEGVDWHGVLDRARQVLAEEYGVTHATIQIEPHDHEELPAAIGG